MTKLNQDKLANKQHKYIKHKQVMSIFVHLNEKNNYDFKPQSILFHHPLEEKNIIYLHVLRENMTGKQT